MPRLCPALVQLRSEVNTKWPRRDKTSDGWIGDPAHAARSSDHNPDSRGVVHAVDIDVDGIDARALLREVIGDPRAEYAIYALNGIPTIWTRLSGWQARRYTGSNPHSKHVHVSARYGLPENSVVRWFNLAPVAPKPTPRPGSTAPGGRVLAAGMVGTDVAFVQRFIGPARCGPADGRFGAKTTAGVRWYQSMRGLPVDGVVGRLTWAAMGVHQ